MRPPVVTDTDRLWALAQCPVWAVRAKLKDDSLPEITDPEDERPAPVSAPRVLVWDHFVSAQIERFEDYFAHERNSPAEWSRLWRKVWWPKADPKKIYPNLVPKAKTPCPVFRQPSPEFDRALAVSTRFERQMWLRLGFAQFAPDDKRVAQVVGKSRLPAEEAKRLADRMTGDREDAG